MPYLGDHRIRRELDSAATFVANSAELNYLFCRLADEYLRLHLLSYDTITAIRGAFKGASEEFERVIAGPYEEMKRQQNGDVWTAPPGQWTGGAQAAP
jgi:hypothetical protein